MPTVVAIDDRDDPRIAAYRDVREGDLVGRDGLFLAEGEVVLRVLLGASRHRPLSLLIADGRLASLRPLLAGLPDAVPVYAAGREVMDGIVGFPIHRGVLALGRRAPMPTARELLESLPPRALAVALFGVANHDNMGGIVRNAVAFGAGAVLIDEACCDPFYRKAIRVSVGAALAAPIARVARADALDLLTAAGMRSLALAPDGARPLAELRRQARMAVLLGAEGPGLPPEILAGAATARIPMAPGLDSLNVATASGIVLHHLAFVAPPEP